jgi:Protein of Unknown function (DUF2784)
VREFYLILADAILVLHALIVLFNVGALPVIWVGRFRGWRFVRDFSFRVIHLLLIAFVAGECVLGVVCPLTTWENDLRVQAGFGARYEGGFVAHWLHRMIFYDLPWGVFAVGYGLFFALVAFTWVWVRPRPPDWWSHRG